MSDVTATSRSIDEATRQQDRRKEIEAVQKRREEEDRVSEEQAAKQLEQMRNEQKGLDETTGSVVNEVV